MNARRRMAARRHWPENLYMNGNGYLWFKNPITGKSAGLGTDLETAIKKVKRANLEIARLQEEQNLLDLTSGGSVTLAARCDEYQKEYAVGKKNTVTAIKSQLNAIRADERSKKPIDQFTPKDAADLIKDAVANRGAQMARTIRTRLKDVFRDAITHGLIERNPVETILKPKITVTRSRMTEEDFWKIYEQAAHPWLKNAMLLALVTGQRFGDILAMRFDDVKDGFLWLSQQKTGKKLKIPVHVGLRAHTLESVISQCRDAVVSRYMIHQVDGRYTTKRGAPVSRIAMQREFQEARERAELALADGATPTTFHEIRSLSARMHAELNGDAFAQALLGHRSAAMTELYKDVRGQQWVEVKAG